MLAGLVAVVALAVTVWALNPSTGAGPLPVLRSAAAGYVLAHFGSISLGTAQLTAAPLAVPMMFGLLLVAASGRGRLTSASARAEAAAIAAGAISYALLVGVVVAVAAPPGARDYRAVLGALLLAGLAMMAGTFWRGDSLRLALLSRLPDAVRTGLRAGLAAASTLLGVAALVTAVALVMSFSRSAEVGTALGSGLGPGVGLTVAGAAYLPNALGAALGYVTGTGFGIGAGQYSPFGSVLADLPPFPLFAAVPQTAEPSPAGLVTLAGPVCAAVVAGISVLRRPQPRSAGVISVEVAAPIYGILLGVLSWLASGGVVGGAWPTMGATGWKVGAVAAGVVLVGAATWVLAGSARWRPDPVPAADEESDQVESELADVS